jgi:hypothetical protein
MSPYACNFATCNGWIWDTIIMKAHTWSKMTHRLGWWDCRPLWLFRQWVHSRCRSGVERNIIGWRLAAILKDNGNFWAKAIDDGKAYALRKDVCSQLVFGGFLASFNETSGSQPKEACADT